MLTWAQIAIGILCSGIAHKRQPNFRHQKKKKRGHFKTQPRTQALTFAHPPLRKDPGALWSRGTRIIQLPRGASKVSNYNVSMVSTLHAKISIV